MVIDSENEGERRCVPWRTDFEPGTGSGEDLWRSCVDLNGENTCEARSCAVEGQFVDSMYDFIRRGNQINFNSYSHYIYSYSHYLYDQIGHTPSAWHGIKGACMCRQHRDNKPLVKPSPPGGRTGC